MKGKSIKPNGSWKKKCKKAATLVLQYGKWCRCCCSWGVMSRLDEAKAKEKKWAIPEDVPKGHFVVYVGEECKRYVIDIALLKHPQFKILLDSAEEMFGFAYGPKLFLPCKEYVFLRILQCIGSSRNHTKLPYVEII